MARDARQFDEQHGDDGPTGADSQVAGRENRKRDVLLQESGKSKESAKWTFYFNR